MKRILLLGLVLLLSGCGTISFPSMNSPKAPDQVYKYRQTINTEPRIVQTNEKGRSVVFTAQSQTIDVGYEKTEKPLSAWQKFCNWLSGLGLLGMVALVLCLFFFPGATIGFLWKKYNNVKTAFKQTVKGIDDSGAVKDSPALAAALSSAQDAKTKALVDDIQQPGK